MKSSVKTIFTSAIIVFIGTIGGFSFFLWNNADSEIIIEKSVPGMDNAPSKAELAETQKVNIGEFFKKFDGKPSCIPGTWPKFRGALSDNIVQSKIPLAEKWAPKGPEVLWHLTLLGEGHAAPAIHNGKVYLLDYDEKEKSDALRCFSLENGKEIWRRWYKVKAKRNHGISRTIPAVTDKYVVTIGPKCQVMCVETDSGKFKWGIDLVREFETKEPFWFSGQCPIIVNNTAVIAPCGKNILMMGVDCETGKIKWKTPNPEKWNMSHSSIMPVTLNGKKMYVYAALGGIIGISAEKENIGEVLWKTAEWNYSVIAPSILYLEEGRFFITAGYGAGGMVFKVNRDYNVEIITKYKPGKGVASEQQTPLLKNGYIFSILPKDAGALRKQFVCYSADNPQTPIWASGDRFGLGPYIIADNKIYILDDDGTLTMIKLNSEKYEVLSKAEIMDGHDAWGPIAIVGKRLLMRDLTRLYCIDIGE